MEKNIQKKCYSFLSNRLKSVVDMVTSGRVVADVGCDHGYVAISLVESGKAARVIAMDVNEGPLERAKEHIREYHLENKIETRLSDGLAAVSPGEAQAAVCAGMGGKLMIGILERSSDAVNRMKELILQPQSDIALVRAYLRQIHFVIEDEKMVLEEGKYYPMLRAIPEEQKISYQQPAATGAAAASMEQTKREAAAASMEERMMELTQLEDQYGPVLLARADEVLQDYLNKERHVYEDILTSLRRNTQSQSSKQRICEVTAKLREIEYVQDRYFQNPNCIGG